MRGQELGRDDVHSSRRTWRSAEGVYLGNVCCVCVCVCKQNKNRILTSHICVLPNEFERSDGFGFALVNFSQHNLTEQRASTWKLHPPKLLRERERSNASPRQLPILHSASKSCVAGCERRQSSSKWAMHDYSLHGVPWCIPWSMQVDLACTSEKHECILFYNLRSTANQDCFSKKIWRGREKREREDRAAHDMEMYVCPSVVSSHRLCIVSCGQS